VHLLHLERTDDVRAHAQRWPGPVAEGASQAARLAGEDVAAVHTAWATFVPFLAHPVTADAARRGMDVLESRDA
jgi:hypothetical protein